MDAPALVGYGDLIAMTAAAGVLGAGDCAGKAVTVDVNPVAQVSGGAPRYVGWAREAR